MKKYISTVFALVLCTLSIKAQESPSGSFVDGKVQGKDLNGELIPIAYANLQWLGTTEGTQTNIDGYYKIKRSSKTTKLVVSYVGYKKDTFETLGKDYFNIELQTLSTKVVKVTKRVKSTTISNKDAIKTENIDETELHKGACCNLSESFETTPSVDVSFTDAVTGTRQIQLLGLAGQYTQILRENIPSIKGLSGIYGLTFVPGSWVESIQLNKGPGSVVNGYESISGQINLELKKPNSKEKLFVNLFANNGGRYEFNLNTAQKVTKRWSTATLLHAKQNQIKFDKNNDGFLDMPLSTHVIGMNRWMYRGNNGWMGQVGVKATYIENIGGQTSFKPNETADTNNGWGLKLNLNRYEAFAKAGKVFDDMPWKSMGFQIAASTHTQTSNFGLKNYDAKENSFYANYIYQSILWNTFHVIKTGVSFKYDKTEETLLTDEFNREEVVPGVFAEYVNKKHDKFKYVAGLRADYHNLYGAFITPRLQLKYDFTKKSILRGSVGRGMRTANIISENSGLLASNRQFIFQGDGSNKPYGLEAEFAWNFGLNYTKKYKFKGKDGSISFDLYRTEFENQIVVDLDNSPQQALFYNLDGRSYSNSFQAQMDYELVKNLDVKVAYRWFDVNTTYGTELLAKPLVSKHRAFANFAYETESNWAFDYTISWQGPKRLPNTESNPEQYQLDKESPSFFLMNAQITKKWDKKLHVYLGVENLLNYKQEDAILASDQPFSSYFDAAQIWGPVFGRNIYGGLRYYLY